VWQFQILWCCPELDDCTSIRPVKVLPQQFPKVTFGTCLTWANSENGLVRKKSHACAAFIVLHVASWYYVVRFLHIHCVPKTSPTLSIVTWRSVQFWCFFWYEYFWHNWPSNDHSIPHLTQSMLLHYLGKVEPDKKLLKSANLSSSHNKKFWQCFLGHNV